MYGSTTVGKNNAQVEGLIVYNQTINALPMSIERFFPSLVGIVISRSNLLAISAGDLQQFPKLLYFDSQANPLVSLEGDTFKHTTKLKLPSQNLQLATATCWLQFADWFE